jgi:hypothetical protein
MTKNIIVSFTCSLQKPSLWFWTTYGRVLTSLGLYECRQNSRLQRRPAILRSQPRGGQLHVLSRGFVYQVYTLHPSPLNTGRLWKPLSAFLSWIDTPSALSRFPIHWTPRLGRSRVWPGLRLSRQTDDSSVRELSMTDVTTPGPRRVSQRNMFPE